MKDNSINTLAKQFQSYQECIAKRGSYNNTSMIYFDVLSDTFGETPKFQPINNKDGKLLFTMSVAAEIPANIKNFAQFKAFVDAVIDIFKKNLPEHADLEEKIKQQTEKCVICKYKHEYELSQRVKQKAPTSDSTKPTDEEGLEEGHDY